MAIVCANPRTKRNNVSFHPFFDGMLNELMNTAASGITQSKHTKSSYPAANIIEEKDRYLVELAIPGLAKEDINLNVEKNVLAVSANKEAITKEGERIVRNEFNYSDFKRTFRLPKTIDTTKIAGKMENGILEITLPKKEEAIDKGPINIAIS